MYCSQCGREVSVEDQYCPGCGARQGMEIVPAEEVYPIALSAEEKKRRAHRRGRRLGNILVSVTALLILYFGNEEIPNASDYVLRRMDTSFFTVQNQREMAVCDGKGTACIIDIPEETLYCADQSRMAYVDRDQELYYLDELSPVYVDDKVQDAVLSFYGDTLAYVKTAEGSGEELCIYDFGTNTCERLRITGCRAFRISPDGRTAACAETDGTLTLWGPDGQKTKIAGNVSEILSLSDDGEMILYRKDSDELFLHAGGREQKAASVSGTIDCLLNETQTEILYTESGTSWYYSKGMDEPVRLTGVKGTVLTSCYMEDTAYQQEQGLILGRKTLRNMPFVTCDTADHSYKIYYLDRTGEHAENILNYAEQFQLSRDGQSLIYLADQKLYQIKNIQDRQDRSCLSGTMTVRQFAADPELQKIWFLTSDPELYYIEKKECVSVSCDIRQMYGACMGGVLFQEGQDLYYTEGKEKELLQADVTDVWIKGEQYVVVDTDRELCYLKDLKDAVALIGSK